MANNKNPSPRARSAAEKNRLIATIAICCAAAALVIGLIIGGVYLVLGSRPEGTMNANLYIAGVNTYGMTKEDAISAVRLASSKTYSVKTMTVTVANHTAKLTPTLTGVNLDVEAAVENAFEGSYITNRQYVFDLVPYLNLDTDAIWAALDELGMNFGTPLTQTTYELTGDVPDLNVKESDEPDQVLVITKGTPEYQLDMQKLYQQVLEGYNTNTFLIEAECPTIEPDALDFDAIWEDCYIAPIDAKINPETFQKTPEVYGYGFDAAVAKTLLDAANYGETVTVTLQRIVPKITIDGLNAGLFHDVLASYTATAKSDPNRDVNLKLACEAINGMVIYPGEIFSYNNALGERTEAKGYKPGPSYLGNQVIKTIGGGICQVSSALYYCAMVADLSIIERESHTFAPEYVPMGMDATVNWGTIDFRFRNSSTSPIRIDATAEGGVVTVSLIGLDSKGYYVVLENEIVKTKFPQTIYQVIVPGSGYSDGQVISTPITGYDVKTYRCKYSLADDTLIDKIPEAMSDYSSVNKIVCKVEPEPTEPPTTLPPPTEPPTAPPTTVPSTQPPVTTAPPVATQEPPAT